MTPPTAPGLAQVLDGFRQAEKVPGDAFAAMFGWIRPIGAEADEAVATRYAALLDGLEADPDAAAAFRSYMMALLESHQMRFFFSDSGILPASGYLGELMRLVTQRVLPELPEDGDFRNIVHRTFHRRHDWIWLGGLPGSLAVRFWMIVLADRARAAPLLRSLLQQMLEAVLVLAYRVGGVDFEQEFHRLGGDFPARIATFRQCVGDAQQYVDAFNLRLHDGVSPVPDEGRLLASLSQSLQVLAEARAQSLRSGTSLHLTHLLYRTWQCVERMQRLVSLAAMWFDSGDADARLRRALASWSQLFRDAARAENQRNSVRGHAALGVSLLARRVTENAARTGEHYIARNRSEYFGIWRAAAGAGLIIAVMALLKILTSQHPAPLGVHALLYSLNYGLGFVIIYLLGLTVATKQPAMTAQTIAAQLGSTGHDDAIRGTEQLHRIGNLFASVARSQAAAILGNVGIAVPTAILLLLLVRALTGEQIVGEDKAMHLLHDLDPASMAIPFAAIAGVYLFFSGLISGYFDNLASHARLGERVARLPWLNRLFGRSGAMRAGEFVSSKLGGLMGNFLFGCMLGMTGTIGTIFGLPLDIRHIAFSSANLGYALAALDFGLPWQTVAWSALGVTLIGATNLAVSFMLALWLALKARGLVFERKREVARHLLLRAARRPWRCLTPPAVTADPEPAGK